MPRRRAFTILELLIALSLASIVIGTIVGMYGLLGSANQNESERFEDAATRVISHETMQRAFGDLVAATPLVAPSPGGAPDEGPGTAVLGAGDRTTTGRTALRATPGRNAPVMFDLSWVETEQGVTVQRLEIVTLKAPVAFELVDPDELEFVPDERELARWRNPERVRSAFEFVYVEDANRWDLQWRAVDPPGQPVTIVEDLAYGQWSVLKTNDAETASEARRIEGWTDVASAFLGEDFPIAVRLEYETRDKQTVDWMFETLVVTREY